MTEACQDPLRFLVERLCCRVYLDGGGNVRLGFSRRHDLKDMMTAQGIARSYGARLRDRLRQGLGSGAEARETADCASDGRCCPLV